MKPFLIALFAFFMPMLASAQRKLEVHDISQKQLRLMQQLQSVDSARRNTVFIDSLYEPYKIFWNGYLGEASRVSNWLQKAMSILPAWQQKNKDINGEALLHNLRKVEKEMARLTGFTATGNWYIVYGPAWTDLGGLGNFAMLIDLAHQSNSSAEKITRMFPHELTHQIMSNVNQYKDTTALGSIIGEGFAVWMNEKYWGNQFTLAQNLGYTEEELTAANSYLDKLKGFFEKNKFSADPDMIDAFRNRGVKLNEKLPGAIGYYIGYHLIQSYVNKNGPNSWKEIFTLPAKQVYENSGFSSTTPTY